MSCRHSLANGTCARCYPKTGTIKPERERGLSMEGPGAVTAEEYQLKRKAKLKDKERAK